MKVIYPVCIFQTKEEYMAFVPDLDTNNTFGMTNYMDAGNCSAMMYRLRYNNRTAMIESLKNVSKTIPEFKSEVNSDTFNTDTYINDVTNHIGSYSDFNTHVTDRIKNYFNTLPVLNNSAALLAASKRSSSFL